MVAAIKNSKQEIANVIMNAIVDACGTSYANRSQGGEVKDIYSPARTRQSDRLG